ncbi:MAG: hypothetical protein WD448_08915, partial [Woeseia sp.]
PTRAGITRKAEAGNRSSCTMSFTNVIGCADLVRDELPADSAAREFINEAIDGAQLITSQVPSELRQATRSSASAPRAVSASNYPGRVPFLP